MSTNMNGPADPMSKTYASEYHMRDSRSPMDISPINQPRMLKIKQLKPLPKMSINS
jgi:hypothetical protein